LTNGLSPNKNLPRRKQTTAEIIPECDEEISSDPLSFSEENEGAGDKLKKKGITNNKISYTKYFKDSPRGI
jgi:hypothetical protein